MAEHDDTPPAGGGEHNGFTWLPGLRLAAHYPLGWLGQDIAAGLVLTALLVPVGIAYAEASGLPGVHGLYATVAALLAYALFGPSRILVLGPDSSLAALVLAVVMPLSLGDPARAVALGGALALVVGVVCLLAGLRRLGFVTELLSKPIRHGYMNGIALTVLVSQLPRLLGVPADGDGLVGDLRALISALRDASVTPQTSALGLGTLAVILLARRWPRVPGLAVAVALATITTAVLELDRAGAVEVMGSMPTGLPGIVFPLVDIADLGTVVLGGMAVALVAFADTSVLSRTFAAKEARRVDANQEMVALGAANLAAALFQGFPISSSSSRTPVAAAAGARSQLAGVVGALAVAALLASGATFVERIPQCALAAVVISAALGLFEVRDLARIYRIQNWEFWLSMACFAGVVVLGVLPGIALAVILAVIEFLWDGWRPHYAVLGRAAGVRGYHDLARYPDARRVPGLVLFRWDAPLFFANADLFEQCVQRAVADSPTPVSRVIVAAEPVTSIDVTSADMLATLVPALAAAGIELHFAEMKDPVKDKLRRFELFDAIGARAFHPTVGAAVDAYLADSGVDWRP